MAADNINELEKLAEAIEKGIFNKAKAIAKELGNLKPHTPITFESRTLKTCELEIIHSDVTHWYSGTEEERSIVYYEDQLVFNGYKKFRTGSNQSSQEREKTAETISAYNPSVGNWTEKIDLLYEQAKKDSKHS